MRGGELPDWPNVHCRTGSLEIPLVAVVLQQEVHCRTGSLEIQRVDSKVVKTVHCRTGSLEKQIRSQS